MSMGAIRSRSQSRSTFGQLLASRWGYETIIDEFLTSPDPTSLPKIGEAGSQSGCFSHLGL